jgi:uncharacterized membrane protein YkvA (DUF1232 family)
MSSVTIGRELGRIVQPPLSPDERVKLIVCRPERRNSIESRTIEFEAPKPFPMAMLDLRNFDGAKVFALIIFLLSVFYFVSGLKTLFLWEDSWWTPDVAMKIVYFCYYLLVFTLVYCFTWLVFDKKGIEGYTLAMFNTVLGIIYVLSPVDFVPEVIPLAGSLDDVIIGIGSVIVGMKGYQNNRQKSDNHNDIVELVEQGKNDEALRLYLKRSGYKVKLKD